MAKIDREHLTRKEMKGPDWFQQAARGATRWTADHRKTIARALLGALVALAAALGVVAWQRNRADEAGRLLYRTLEAVGADVSAVAIPGSDRPAYPSEVEKLRAVLDSAAELRARYPSGAAARTAALASGDAHLRLGAFDEALADYRAFLEAAPEGESLRFSALLGIGYALEAKGDFSGAAQAFERLGQEVPFMKDRAALERARVLARAGKVDEARKLLGAFPEEFQDSPLRPEAQERLSRLGASS